MEKITKLLTHFVGLLIAITASAFVAEANATNYNLYIDGTRVTSDNASDVKGDGVFVYDASTNILHINGSYTTTASPSSTNRIVDSSISGLTVMINNNAELTFHECAVFHFSESATITGSGKLTVNSTNECGFYLTNGAELTIDNAKDIDIYAQWGIAGPNTPRGEKLTINNSNVDITSSIAAISDLSGGFYLFNGFINSPSGAYFDTKDLKDADGDVATSVVITNTMTTTIDGINYELTPATHEAEVIWGEYAGEITIPASVTYEGEPFAVTAIHEWAFSYAPSGITSVTLPEGLTTIGNGVFNGCSSLTHVELPSTLTNVGQYQFLGCSALTSVSCFATTPPVVPDEFGVFVGLPNSVMLFVPEGSVSAYKNAPGWKDFGNIYGVVTKVQQTIDGIIYEIDLRNMTAMVITDWVTEYSGDITIPSSVIYEGATYPVTAVNGFTFFQDDVTSVTISEGPTTIGDGAFNSCESLTSVTLPSTLTNVGQYLFSGCNSLESVTCYAETPPVVGGEGSVYMIPENNTATLYVPAGCVSAYQAADGWSDFSNIVEIGSVPSDPELIVNGNIEGDDISAFSYHVGSDSGPITSSFIENEKGNHFIAIESIDKVASAWDSQFFVSLNRPVVAGEKLYFSMRAKASQNASISSQAHTTPGGYLTWNFVGGFDLTTEWQKFTKEVTVTTDMAGAQCIAFMLNEKAESTFYYFDNLSLSTDPNGGYPDPIDYGDNMIVNGNFEGTDMSAFSKVEQNISWTPSLLTLDDVVEYVTNNHCLFTHFGQVEENQEWKNRFIVNLNGTLEPGDHFRFSMRAKASGDVMVSGHGLTSDSNISIWGLIGSMSLTDGWQTFELEGVVPTTAEGPVNQLQFYMAVNDVDGMDFYFDDMFLAKETDVEPDTDYSSIDNTLYLEPVQGISGGQTVLSVKMKNTVDIQGYQFDLYLPAGVTVATDGDGFPMVELSEERTTARKTNFFEATPQADGSLRVLCGTSAKDPSTGDPYAFEGTDGEVARITVNLASTMTEGDYAIVLKNATVSDVNGTAHRTERLKSTLSVIDYIPGDVNGDLIVDVADFMAVANYILNNPVAVFIEKAADVAGSATGGSDGMIDVADFMGVANIILHKDAQGVAPKKAAPAPRKAATDIDALDNAIYVEPVTAAPGTQQVLSVRMKNTGEVSAFEFSLQLPEGITVASDAVGLLAELSTERTTARKTNFFDTSLQADGTLKVLCGTSAKDEATGNPYAFEGNEGEVALITIEVPEDYEEGVYEVSVIDGKISDPTGVKTDLVSPITTELTIGDTTIVLDENSTDDIPSTAAAVPVKVLRTFKQDTWSTVCFPFAMTGEQLIEVFGDDVEIKNFVDYEPEFIDDSDDVESIRVHFDYYDPADGLLANYPVLLKTTKEDFDEFTLTTVLEPDEEEAVKDYFTGRVGRPSYHLFGQLRGVYKKTAVPEDCLFISENKFWYSTGATTMKAFRAYFWFEDVIADVANAGANIQMVFDKTTEISEKVAVNGEETDTWYTLDGMKLEKKPTRKGVYIFKGKKQVVK